MAFLMTACLIIKKKKIKKKINSTPVTFINKKVHGSFSDLEKGDGFRLSEKLTRTSRG